MAKQSESHVDITILDHSAQFHNNWSVGYQAAVDFHFRIRAPFKALFEMRHKSVCVCVCMTATTFSLCEKNGNAS